MLHRIGDLWIDGHHDDGAFAIRITLELAQQRQHFGGFVAIQTDGRLVGDDHFGFAAQGTRYCHAALIEFAQLTDRQSGGRLGEPHSFEQLSRDHRLRLEEIAVRSVHRIEDVAFRVELTAHGETLRNEADAMPEHVQRLHFVQIGAFVHHIAAIRTNHAHHRGEQRLMLFVVFGIHQHGVGCTGLERQ